MKVKSKKELNLKLWPSPIFGLLLSALLPLGSLIALPYTSKDYSHLIGMEGFSEKALQLHFKLYQGYVAAANELTSKIKESSGAVESELKRRLAWELNGMRLHELYFDNLGSQTLLSNESPLYKRIIKEFGSIDQWKRDFIQTGSMRGIGWVVLCQDSADGRLYNLWIGEHDMGHLAGAKPLLVMDVFEHAYMLDYLSERIKYIEAFFKNINWKAVQNRFEFI